MQKSFFFFLVLNIYFKNLNYEKFITYNFSFFISHNCFSQFNFQRSWGTYFGDERYQLSDSKLDSAGNLYIVGTLDGTQSTVFSSIVTNALSYKQNYGGGDSDGYIVKFNPAGAIIWASYLGGENTDKIRGIAIDSNENIYILGCTYSLTGIATSSSFQPINAGNGDYFISKFSSSGSIIWSSYYGGTDQDYDNSQDISLAKISFDGVNNIYIAASTFSTTLSTPGVFQAVRGTSNYLITKFDINGTKIWATYYGVDTFITSIKSNSYGVIITGTTNDCPPQHSYNTYYGSANGFKPLPSNCREIFLSKFDTNGQREWSTYYGGTAGESVLSNAIELKGDKIYLAGYSSNYTNQEVTTLNTYQPNCNINSNFIAQVNQDGTRNWGTYNGDAVNLIGQITPISSVITEDLSASFYNFGSTRLDANISSTDGYLTTPNNTNSNDAYICKFRNENEKAWGTYYGGELEEYNVQFHPYQTGSKFYILGSTKSLTQIASPNALQQNKTIFDSSNNTIQNVFNIFIAHFEPNPLSNTTFTENSFSIFPNPNNGTFKISFSNLVSENNTLELYDLIGHKIMSQKLNNTETVIETKNLSKGVYFAKITSENNSITKKIIIE